MKTAPCNKIKTCGRAKIRVREKPQQVPERHEGCKAKQSTSEPAKTYRSPVVDSGAGKGRNVQAKVRNDDCFFNYLGRQSNSPAPKPEATDGSAVEQ